MVRRRSRSGKEPRPVTIANYKEFHGITSFHFSELIYGWVHFLEVGKESELHTQGLILRMFISGSLSPAGSDYDGELPICPLGGRT